MSASRDASFGLFTVPTYRFRGEASTVDLPTPDLVSSLFPDEGEVLFLSSCDLLQYYNRLRAPFDLVPFLGFPWLKERLLWMTTAFGYVTTFLTRILMGASFAVSLAQRVSNAVLCSASLPPPTPFASLHDSRIRKGSITTLPYIDDINIIGTSVSVVNSARDKAAAAFSKANLPTELSKNVDAGTGDYSVAIGLAWWRHGSVIVKPTHTKKLFSSTNRVLSH